MTVVEATPGPGGRSVTSRALSVLDAFDPAHRRLTLSEISRRAGLPLATAHRLVRELEGWRALERGPDGRYEVGLRLWELGSLALANSHLRATALPHMQDLFEASGENVHLAVLDGPDALYVEKVNGTRSVPIVSHVGSRLPLHATGVGKVLLAFAAAAGRRVEVLSSPLPRITPFTLTEPGRVAEDLAAVRRRGYAVTREEMTLGTCSVAVPVRGPDGQCVAALGLVLHSARVDLKRWVAAVTTAGARISAEVSRPVSGARAPGGGVARDLVDGSRRRAS